jgi:hypothetical protein
MPLATIRRDLPSLTRVGETVSTQYCLIGAPQLTNWMKQHPAERLAIWCQHSSAGEVRVESGSLLMADVVDAPAYAFATIC